GVWYDVNTDRWIIYAEDFAAIPLDSAFFYAVNPEVAQTLTHRADAGNISGNWTEIDHPLLNNNPNGIVVLTHNWGVSGAPSNVLMDKAVGVWYTGSNWAVFTEDLSAMPVDIEFDLMIFDPTLGTEDTTIEGLSYGPNPFTDIVNIQAKEPITSVTLYNVLGTEVSQFTGEGNAMGINLSNYASGVYIARIVVGNTTQTVKLIKQ
ncbi:MAG: T9SS type A sorting domain-containing protein, partial [Bacteroidia bacterium]|nr:T9SS type A sorting domain-containing protein [Bacteroidia bacterium]MBT8276008.1 T9SS type A sorting domain-containing protein [Bacteroidia bacterium]NNF29792.1 T9SS type A sorting domain-containing protein [Flavobacteriaceae bacterium]NNK55334.1 T9SS type A sorting domain-containing protein [Flavobacteriaceae bacterium]NNM08592.1 T9SS type A sorting domain-containing protein [Flavobacteriaceae bacterium]